MDLTLNAYLVSKGRYETVLNLFDAVGETLEIPAPTPVVFTDDDGVLAIQDLDATEVRIGDDDQGAVTSALFRSFTRSVGEQAETYSFLVLDRASVADYIILPIDPETGDVLIEGLPAATDYAPGDPFDGIDVTLPDLRGSAGDDTIAAAPAAEIVDLITGQDVLSGPVASFFGDTIANFGTDDEFRFEEAIDRAQIAVTEGSAILGIDTDNDGSANGSLTLTGDFSGGDFMAAATATATVVTYVDFLPTLAEQARVADGRVNGIANQTFLTGDGATDFEVSLGATAEAAFDNALGVYEIDAADAIVDVRILFPDVGDTEAGVVTVSDVAAGNRLGFFVIQNGAGLAAAIADAEVLEFVDGGGGAATLDDGADLVLRADGRNRDAVVFHSFSADMNDDGLIHALSGVEAGGEALTVGFEDLVGGGDRDFQDVLFTVSQVDAAVAEQLL